MNLAKFDLCLLICKHRLLTEAGAGTLSEELKPAKCCSYENHNTSHDKILHIQCHELARECTILPNGVALDKDKGKQKFPSFNITLLH